ncbi:MAG: hypothetical protein ACP5R5_05545, partial [Armatimonadota bacterium]
MSRAFLATIVLAALLAANACAIAAGWTKLGTSGFTTTPSWMQDPQRIRFNSIAFDGQGNIYATACNGNNNGMPGGLTIFQPNGTKIADVDLNALGYPGAITKLVTGGDGVVYALQNWLEIGWSFNAGVNRILAIQPNGSVIKIWDAHKPTEQPETATDANRIGGMTVGPDGNIYWTTNAADSYWKYHFFWRYDVAGGTVEETPFVGNIGWSETHRMFDLEYVGSSPDGYNYAVIVPVYSSWIPWRLDRMSWTSGRESGNVCNPGWGRDWITATAYDPVNDVLWVGGRGRGSGPWSWSASNWGTSTPPSSSWSVVDLGGGNKGLQVNKGTDYDAYFRIDGNDSAVTAAARFRVEAYSGNYTDNAILNLRGVGSPDGIPWPIVKVKNGYFKLEFISATTSVQLGPVDNAWHEVRITTDRATKKASCYWDGQKVYDGQPDGLRT